MRYANFGQDIDAKVNAMCKLAAEELIRRAREMQPIPTFSYRRPELYRPRSEAELLKRALNATRDAIRCRFGLPMDS